MTQEASGSQKSGLRFEDRNSALPAIAAACNDAYLSQRLLMNRGKLARAIP
ncbi:MAG: hypothetical protein IT342_06875 [Candidatus Melainabacteria bacterium]|nr:hypothetical protein [Candidatus Melainabacteria bacterium]